jgi:hypothetical protein
LDSLEKFQCGKYLNWNSTFLEMRWKDVLWNKHIDTKSRPIEISSGSEICDMLREEANQLYRQTSVSPSSGYVRKIGSRAYLDMRATIEDTITDRNLSWLKLWYMPQGWYLDTIASVTGRRPDD